MGKEAPEAEGSARDDPEVSESQSPMIVQPKSGFYIVRYSVDGQSSNEEETLAFWTGFRWERCQGNGFGTGILDCRVPTDEELETHRYWIDQYVRENQR